jgi:S1-C subfamily serine protease
VSHTAPDLVVSSVDAPATATCGDTVTVSVWRAGKSRKQPVVLGASTP